VFTEARTASELDTKSSASELDTKSSAVCKSREGTRCGAALSREAVKQGGRVESASELACVAKGMHASLAKIDAVTQRVRDRSAFLSTSKAKVPDE
jgi:hypothetical protein